MKVIFVYKNKKQEIKNIFIYKNNLTNSKKKLIIYLGDIYVKKRDVLKRIRESYNSDLIKILVGIRRCGKSVILRQIIEELKEKGIKEEHIIFINFEI